MEIAPAGDGIEVGVEEGRRVGCGVGVKEGPLGLAVGFGVGNKAVQAAFW